MKAGDTLVVLDRRDFIVRLEQAEADLRNAEAAVGSRRTGGQAERTAPGHAGPGRLGPGHRDGGEADAPSGGRRLQRYRKLAAPKIVSAQQLDAALSARDAAAANLESARRRPPPRAAR